MSYRPLLRITGLLLRRVEVLDAVEQQPKARLEYRERCEIPALIGVVDGDVLAFEIDFGDSPVVRAAHREDPALADVGIGILVRNQYRVLWNGRGD